MKTEDPLEGLSDEERELVARRMVTPAVKAWLVEHTHAQTTWTDVDLFVVEAAEALTDGRLPIETFQQLLDNEEKTMNSPDPNAVFAGSGQSRIRVKDPSERYSTTKTVGRHVKTGQQVHNPFTRQPTELPSELETACNGALIKQVAKRSGLVSCELSEHEQSLLDAMAHKDVWAGNYDGEYHDKIPGSAGIKALLDDAPSGGLELTPATFDDSIITFPLLHGELLPKVDLRPVAKGSRIEGGSLGNPTISWGQGDDTTAGLFNTAALAGAIDSTVYGAAVAVEVGRDFLSDAAVDVGSILTGNIGQRMMEELDQVIATGDGTSQPEGLTNAAGITTINTDNAAGGPWTLNDYIELHFTLGKQYRNASYNPTFVSNDTVFQRSRAIQIDESGGGTDQRPVMMPSVDQVNKYSSLGWSHAVQNDIGNRVLFFGGLKRYRLYRRQGMEVRIIDGGTTLARKNEVLLLVRARYAGQVVDANGFAKYLDGQA